MMISIWLYVAAVVFTLIAIYARPNGGLMIINILVIPVVLLGLIIGASNAGGADTINYDLGGEFDYTLFTSIKWWMFFVPISIMIARITLHFMKKSHHKKEDA